MESKDRTMGETAHGSPIRVLLIEDDRVIAAAMIRKLNRFYQASTAHCAKDALARIRRGEHYDVILCDLDLVDCSGVELYERLPAPMRRRVVFLSDCPEKSRLPRPCLLKPAYTLEVQRALSLADMCDGTDPRRAPSRREAITVRTRRVPDPSRPV